MVARIWLRVQIWTWKIKNMLYSLSLSLSLACIITGVSSGWIGKKDGGEPCVINLMNLYFLCPRTKSSFCATWPRRRLAVFGIITKWNIFPLLPNKFYFPAVAPSFCGCCVCECVQSIVSQTFLCALFGLFLAQLTQPDSANGCCESHWGWACSAGRVKNGARSAATKRATFSNLFERRSLKPGKPEEVHSRSVLYPNWMQ